MIKKALKRHFEMHGNFQLHLSPCLLFIFCHLCKLFFFFLIAGWVCLSSQLGLSALSLGPKAPSVSLCREHCQGPRSLTLALKGDSQHCPRPRAHWSQSPQSAEVTGGKGQRMEPRDHSKRGSSCEAVPDPLLSQLGFWLRVPWLV